MAGHSKWHNIKHKKAKEDAKKGLIFTKLGKEISIAVKHGGPDPAANVTLRLLLEKAKENNVPKDNIERAIKKGSGQLEGVNYEEIFYQGYAPENVALMIQALTDNKNRTISDLRHFFNKHGGQLVDAGSLNWMFESAGQVEFEHKNKSEEELLETLLEGNITDLKITDQETALAYCEVADTDKLRQFIESQGFTVKSMEKVWIGQNPTKIDDGEKKDSIHDFLSKLEDLEDVQNLFVNLE